MSIGIRKTFNLDMVPGGAPPVIHVSAGDVGRPFRAVLLYNGEGYDLEDVTSVKIRGTKPDNTVFEYALTYDDEDSHVDFVIEEQMAIIAGQVLCEIRLFSGDDTIGSANFILDVETAVYDPEAASESYVPQIEDAINEAIENVADTITEAAKEGAIDSVKQYADDAEAWATGSVDGTDVTSTADQYHNNAKYYSEQAGAKATAAAASAAEAMSGTPDGYAALVDTVNKLDSISYIIGEAVPINTTVTGWRLAGPPSNGAAENTTGILRKYQVTAGQTLYLKLSDGFSSYDNRATYQFQSSSSVPSGNNSNIVGEAVNGDVDGLVTVPTGATWLIVCEKSGSTGNEVKNATTIKDIDNTIAALNRNKPISGSTSDKTTLTITFHGAGNNQVFSCLVFISDRGLYLTVRTGEDAYDKKIEIGNTGLTVTFGRNEYDKTIAITSFGGSYQGYSIYPAFKSGVSWEYALS